MENSMETAHKIKNRTIIWPSYSISRYLSEEHENINLKDIGTLIFIAALFTIAKTWEQLKYPSIDEWIKKVWYRYRYVMVYYSP